MTILFPDDMTKNDKMLMEEYIDVTGDAYAMKNIDGRWIVCNPNNINLLRSKNGTKVIIIETVR